MPLTDLSWLEVGAAFPPKSEQERLATYSVNRKLFEGSHEQVFSDSWARLLRQNEGLSYELTLNWTKRLSTLWADLLAGDPPVFQLDDGEGPEQEALDAIIERNHFDTLLYDIAIDQSRFGDGIFKLGLKDGEATIGGQSPVYWFPVVSIGDVRDVQYHVLAWPFKAIALSGSGATRGKELDMLKVEVHEKGSITHKVLAVNNSKIEHEESLAAHFPGQPPTEETGIDDFLVHQASGLRPIDRLYGLDDYGDVESVVQEMEVRLAQIARVLDNHADPTMYGPDALIMPGNKLGLASVKTGGFMPLPEEYSVAPGYIALPDTLQHAFAELEELKLQFFLITETSPAAFGQADAGLATSGTALRRLMQAPLAKARRLRMRLDPVAKRVLEIAMELEQKGGNLNQRDATKDKGGKNAAA